MQDIALFADRFVAVGVGDQERINRVVLRFAPKPMRVASARLRETFP
jgi:hypothetical protein